MGKEWFKMKIQVMSCSLLVVLPLSEAYIFKIFVKFGVDGKYHERATKRLYVQAPCVCISE